MLGIELLAKPWWVNLAILIPVCSYIAFRRKPLSLSKPILGWSSAFAAGFGFVEASVVVYLRSALGLAHGAELTLRDVEALASEMQRQAANITPTAQSLMVVEVVREAATMVMLIAVAMLAARSVRDRYAVFLWCFAIWDLVYYLGLWAAVRWPESLLTVDVLFLIPVPWISQVWFPVLISSLSMLAVIAGREKAHR